MDFTALKDVLTKLEEADIAILEASLVPALLKLGVTALPAADQPFANAILAAIQGPLQSALSGLLAKVPVV